MVGRHGLHAETSWIDDGNTLVFTLPVLYNNPSNDIRVGIAYVCPEPDEGFTKLFGQCRGRTMVPSEKICRRPIRQERYGCPGRQRRRKGNKGRRDQNRMHNEARLGEVNLQKAVYKWPAKNEHSKSRIEVTDRVTAHGADHSLLGAAYDIRNPALRRPRTHGARATLSISESRTALRKWETVVRRALGGKAGDTRSCGENDDDSTTALKSAMFNDNTASSPVSPVKSRSLNGSTWGDIRNICTHEVAAMCTLVSNESTSALPPLCSTMRRRSASIVVGSGDETTRKATLDTLASSVATLRDIEEALVIT